MSRNVKVRKADEQKNIRATSDLDKPLIDVLADVGKIIEGSEKSLHGQSEKFRVTVTGILQDFDRRIRAIEKQNA